MEKEFIPYAEALALKELGFNQKCLGQYNISQGDKWIFSIDLSGEGQYPLTSPACITPLYQQAFRWFREKYSYQSFISPSNELTYLAYDFTLKGFDGYFKSKQFKTYEEAELACLEKLIEIVESKKE
jgi:hypothetical protein